MPKSAVAYVASGNGRKLGSLSVLGRGGFQVDTKKRFKMGDLHKFFIVDESEGIKRSVTAVVRNMVPGSVGFEFEELDPDAAVEIGIVIGKYYSSAFE